MYDFPSPNERLADTVNGARFVSFHPSTHRLFVWKSGPVVDIVNVRDGEVIAHWPCDDTAESAAAIVTERTNAGY